MYLLTGTPLTNRPRDLFVLLQLAGHSLGRSFLSFAKRYCAAVKNGYGWKTDGASNLEELTVQLHGVMLRRSKDAVLALPPKLRTWLPVEVPEGTGAEEIRAVIYHLLRTTDPASKGAGGGGQGRDRIKLLALLTKARRRLAVAKADATIDFVSGAVGQGEKVIVFSCFDESPPARAAARGSRALETWAHLSRSGEHAVEVLPLHQRHRLAEAIEECQRITLRSAQAQAVGDGLGAGVQAGSFRGSLRARERRPRVVTAAPAAGSAACRVQASSIASTVVAAVRRCARKKMTDGLLAPDSASTE